MAENKKPNAPRFKKISAFALAINSPSVTAEIDIGDVLEIRPAWTAQQAAAFLHEHADAIGAVMVLRGVEMLTCILGGDENVQ